MKDLLLDTHVWIWISIDDRRSLSRKARTMLLDQPSGRKWISAISCWELAKLAEKGRIGFSMAAFLSPRQDRNRGQFFIIYALLMSYPFTEDDNSKELIHILWCAI
jgi:PIN domain nuclease of toxin-antitoxin system